MSDLSKSADGKNKHILLCKPQNRQQHYAVCLHTIKRHNEGQEALGGAKECVKCFRDGSCIAMEMRAKEEAAGKSIYYKSPTQPKATKTDKDKKYAGSSGFFQRLDAKSRGVDVNSESYRRGWESVGKGPAKSSSKKAAFKSYHGSPQKKTEAKSDSGLVEMDHADVVNRIKDKEQPKPKEAKKEASVSGSSKPIPGESPLEFAIRIKKLKAK